MLLDLGSTFFAALINNKLNCILRYKSIKLENHFTTVLTMRRSSKDISHNSSTLF